MSQNTECDSFGHPEFIVRTCVTTGSLDKVNTFLKLSDWLANTSQESVLI